MATISDSVTENTAFLDIVDGTAISHDALILELVPFDDVVNGITGPSASKFSRYVNPYVEYKDYNGQQYAFGALYFYSALTNEPIATFMDFAQTMPNPNPIPLDARGSPGNVFLAPGVRYKMILTDANGDQIWTREWINPQSQTL